VNFHYFDGNVLFDLIANYNIYREMEEWFSWILMDLFSIQNDVGHMECIRNNGCSMDFDGFNVCNYGANGFLG
jgi:hypothetical protein